MLAGGTASLSLLPCDITWKDASRNLYLPSAQPAQFKAGGALFIDSVTPGGGLLSSGTQVRITGRGFTASTTVGIVGIALASTAFVGPQAIDITLTPPTDLIGKRVLVENPGGVASGFLPSAARRYCRLFESG